METKKDIQKDRPLSAVTSHLRALAGQVAATVGDLARIRGLIETYSDVDPSIIECRASSRPVTAGDVPCEWLISETNDPDRRLMYVHGGSWMAGSLAGYRAHAGRIAEITGYSVLNVDYRLAPENPFPAGLNDCNKALDWMVDNGPDDIKPARSTIIAGDSAGGNLILALLLKRRDQEQTLPNAAVALSPATDLTWGSPSIVSRAQIDPILRPDRLRGVVTAYLQDQAATEDPYVSPLFGELMGLPPLLLQVGEAEVLFDDALQFAQKATRAGVSVRLDSWPDMPHVFQMFAPYLPQANQALEVIAEFVRNTESSS